MDKGQKTKSKEQKSDVPLYARCKLKFKGAAEYGRAIHKIKGVTYELTLNEYTEVDLAHLEALKDAEKNLEVNKDGIN
ncbi:MAG: hypothetical protein ACE5I1_11445 [bacterium]